MITDLSAVEKALPSMSAQDKLELLQELETLEQVKQAQLCRDDFLAFCKAVYPDFKEGPHHRYMKPLLHQVLSGDQLRLTVSMPPRHGKSETLSYLYVAWYLGHNPRHTIIMCTHTASLSAAFGRKIRNLINSEKYQSIFPDTIVSADKSAADDWTTTAGGSYLAVGVGANIAGRGAHLCLHPLTRVKGPGASTIGAAQIGDTLDTHDGRQKITKKLLTTHTQTFILNGDLQSSATHPFHTQRGWVQARDLQVGDRLTTCTVWRTLWEKTRRLLNLPTRPGAA